MNRIRVGCLVMTGLVTLLLNGGMTALAQKDVKPQKAKITGTIEFKGEVKFDADTVARITLQDVSRADAPAKNLGEQTIKNLKKFPIAFEVEYDPTALKQNLMYAIRVRIETRGRLDYINDTAILVISRNHPSTDIKVPVIRVGQ